MEHAVMICGYRTHGKDFFFKKLVKEIDNKFICLAKFENKINDLIIILNSEKFKRIAFADCLKQSLNFLNPTDKDIKKYHKIDGKYVEVFDSNLPLFSFRDILIEHAKIMKEKDINHWVKLGISELDFKSCNVITDWRFYHEYDCLSEIFPEIFTFRIFNFEKDIPSSNVDSEHELDYFETDFIILPFDQIDFLEKGDKYKYQYVF